MSIISRTPTAPEPLWDSNTDEIAQSISASSVYAYTVPQNCYAIICSHNAGHNDGLYVSPNASDVDSGLKWGSTADQRLTLYVRPGAVLQFHNPSGSTAIILNVVQFYNQP